MNINAAYYSSVGYRQTNEDSVTLLENPKNVIALFADGLGGEGNGHLASRVAVQTISGLLSAAESEKEEITSAIMAANDKITELQINNNKMKSTIACLYLSSTRSFAVTIGDTRIYQIRDGNVLFQSVDHSVSQMSVNVGEITVDQIRGHADRNKLTNALGSGKRIEPEPVELYLREGDAFLLCSDGFWEYVLEPEMCGDLRACANADEWLRRMRDRVESRNNRKGDNHSAIAIIILGG